MNYPWVVTHWIIKLVKVTSTSPLGKQVSSLYLNLIDSDKGHSLLLVSGWLFGNSSVLSSLGLQLEVTSYPAVTTKHGFVYFPCRVQHTCGSINSMLHSVVLRRLHFLTISADFHSEFTLYPTVLAKHGFLYLYWRNPHTWGFFYLLYFFQIKVTFLNHLCRFTISFYIIPCSFSQSFFSCNYTRGLHIPAASFFFFNLLF